MCVCISHSSVEATGQVTVCRPRVEVEDEYF